MVAIAAFGLIMVLISLVMITKPDAWGRCIVRFCRMPYMHPLEMTIRLGFGLLFLQYADGTKFPLIIKMMGYVLVAAGVSQRTTSSLRSTGTACAWPMPCPARRCRWTG